MDEDKQAKIAWLCRYRDSLRKIEDIRQMIAEVRGRSVGVVLCWNVRSAPTNTVVDRVADTAQRLDQLERELKEEQERGQSAAVEIINSLFGLPLKSIFVLSYTYLDGLSNEEIAKEMGVTVATVRVYRRKALEGFRIPDPAEPPQDNAQGERVTSV